MPKISVIIPVYKVERYLDACVASVAGQTYPDLEIILVDDGSPDTCPALCDAWAERDERVRVIHQPNGGTSSARNHGLDVMRGQLVAFVDGDDRLEPDTLRRAVEMQEQTNADVTIFNMVFTDAEDLPLDTPDFTIFKDCVRTPQEVWNHFFTLDERCLYYASVCNKLYKAELFASLRFVLDRRHEDMRLMPAVLDQCKTVACLGYRGYRRTKHADSYMEQTASQKDVNRSEFMLEWTSYFTRKGEFLRAEGILNDAIAELAQKQSFDLSTPDLQARYRTACRACADAYRDLAKRTGQRSMLLRAALLRLGLPVYQAFLKHKT